MSIRLNRQTTERSVWVAADHPMFDDSEFSHDSKEERSQIKFLIRPFTPKVLERIERRYGGLEVIANSRGRRTRLNKAIGDYVIEDWFGIEDEEGKDLPCTKDNKFLMIENGYPGIAACLVEIAEVLISQSVEFPEVS